MKAFLFGVLAVSASALTLTTSCQIPSPYVTTATDGSCTGSAAPYAVSVVCVSSTNTGVVVTEPLTSGTAYPAFSVSGSSGCYVPDFYSASTVNGQTCSAASRAAWTSSTYNAKGISIDCASGYYQSNTLPQTGPLLCGSLVTTESQTSFFVPPGELAANALQVTGTNRLICAGTCTLPSTFCSGSGTIASGITLLNAGNAQIANTCTILPGSSVLVGIYPNNLALYNLTCTVAADGSVSLNTDYFPFGVSGSGAISGPIIGPDASAGTLGPNYFDGFDSAVATLVNYATSPYGQWAGYNLRAAFQTATVQVITVTGCPTGSNLNACVQQAINAWRCRGFIVDTATICVAGGAIIACPSWDNGWRCNSSGSKKGLLGLLGLLGLIPLCLLLLCCCLIPCCLRRRKTEADVHFATFDPHAAPVAASVIAPAIPTALCAPTAVCAEPCVEPFVGSYGAQFAAPATPIF